MGGTRAVLVKRFERILATHQASLRRVSASYTSGGAEREDLLQEICLALWKALPGFREECSERTFVFRIAHNRGLTNVARRRPAAHDLEEASTLADPAGSPETLASDDQRRLLLLEAVRALPMIQRQVVTLSLEGLSHKEIGEVLGISETNVAVRLSRGKSALRERLQGANI